MQNMTLSVKGYEGLGLCHVQWNVYMVHVSHTATKHSTTVVIFKV